MPKIDDLTRLKHIQQAIAEAMSFVEGRSRTDLETERMLSLALVRLIEILVRQLIIFLGKSKIGIQKYRGEG